jgi:hypothetical protein
VPRAKLPSIPSLKRKLWKLCSEFNRRKDCDETGTGNCISCGALLYWKDGDAGHFIPRARQGETYYLKENIHLQCKRCNGFDVERGKIGYTMAMIDKYGAEKIEELQALSRKQARYRRADYEWMIDEYQELLRGLNE